MARMRFEPIPDLGDKLLEAIKPKLDAHIGQLNTELDAELNEVIRQLARDMSGRPADEVLAELWARIQVWKPGISMIDENIPAIAERISAGTWPTAA
jgi:hypothetical protein